MKYNFSEIEKKWQDIWEKEQTFIVKDNVKEIAKKNPQKKYYVLDMFPYPSGAGLHVGHIEGYTATDIVARYKRHKGFNVLHCIGWDAFGLPAEQHALKTGIHPAINTKQNVDNFRITLKKVGFSFDWSREIDTTDPAYYKWTQWIFSKLYERGLAYIKEVPINWCVELNAVLANEEIDEQVEKGYTIVQRPLKQWILRIPLYADRLLNDLELLDWPEHLKEMQRNWIGRSEGLEMEFALVNETEKIRIYTTRPDTIFGATFVILSPEHSLVNKITTDEYKDAVKEYQYATSLKTNLERTGTSKEKVGVFTGAFAINPASGEKIPVWISDFVLVSYGTGAIMSVPAHDQRDWEFAKKYSLPIREVVKSPHSVQDAVFVSYDSVACNSQSIEIDLNGYSYRDAFNTMIAWAERKKIGNNKVNYKLRDWIFSRQRYWGEPIPIKHYEDGTMELEKNIPLTLPPVTEFKPTGTGESPLANADTLWLYGEDAKGKFRRETNTMPQWAGSCWYYLRYIDAHNDNEFVSKEKEAYWMNVDLYVGGAEHAVLHLLYARFWHKVLYDIGVVSTIEPFQKLVNQGMILGEDNTKMSKSVGNTVSADDVLQRYGADAIRLYEMFMGPIEETKPWSMQNVEGLNRFLGKVWRLVYPSETEKTMLDVSPISSELQHLLHKTIKKVGEDIEALKFNTAISQLMILINAIQKENCKNKSVIESFILMLSPFAPHITEELWQVVGHTKTIAYEPFPTYDEALIKDTTVTIAVQVNGKLRGTFQAEVNTIKDDLLAEARQVESVIKFLENKEIKKEIVVENKLINFVVT